MSSWAALAFDVMDNQFERIVVFVENLFFRINFQTYKFSSQNRSVSTFPTTISISAMPLNFSSKQKEKSGLNSSSVNLTSLVQIQKSTYEPSVQTNYIEFFSKKLGSIKKTRILR